MKHISIFLLALYGLTFSLSAQADVDIKNEKVNPMTFVFSDGKHTLNGYIYSVLEEKTGCCGNDAIYLEVVFNATGIVTSAKTLTGKNNCYRTSVVDIVKNVQWDAAGVNGSKTVYFEVKPVIPCSGAPGENEYVAGAIATDAVAGVTTTPKEEVVAAVEEVEEAEEEFGEEWNEALEETEEVVEEVEEEAVAVVEEVEEEVEEVVETVTVKVEEEEEEAEEVVEVAANTMKQDAEEEEEEEESATEMAMEEGFLSEEAPVTKESTPKVAAKKSTPRSGNGKPLYDGEYVSQGDRSPDKSHIDSFDNIDIPKVPTPTFKEGETEVAIYIKKGLREKGHCGFAQALVELTLDPQGNVVGQRVMKSNSEEVEALLPEILGGMKFKDTASRFQYITYIQFKTDIMCKGKAGEQVDLDSVEDYLTVDGN